LQEARGVFPEVLTEDRQEVFECRFESVSCDVRISASPVLQGGQTCLQVQNETPGSCLATVNI
jgi:hypothetical protein